MFNNREWALFTWIAVFLIWLLSKADLRKSLRDIVKAMFAWKLAQIYIVMLIYTVGMVLLLNTLNLWDETQIKNTVFWFFTVGLFSMNDIVSDKESNFFRKTLKDVFAATAIVQFFVGVYSFSYWIELLILPILVLIGGTLAVANNDPKHKDVKSFLSGLVSFIGFLFIVYSLFKIITDFNSFANKGTLNDFMIPAVLSFLFLPLVYVLSVIALREIVFIGVSRSIKNESLLRYAKWQTLLHFRFRKADLKRWQTLTFQRNVSNKVDVRKSIRFIKERKRIEENPPSVDESKGWSPYKAKDFLLEIDIATGLYSPAYENEWFAASPYVQIGTGYIKNNIAYYVSGDNELATELKIVLNINEQESATIAHEKFSTACEMIFQKAIGEKMPMQLSKATLSGKAHKSQIKNKVITLSKTMWEGHKENGYTYSFTIRMSTITRQ